MYLPLKAVQWFTISERLQRQDWLLLEVRQKSLRLTPPTVNLQSGDVLPIMNHCTAFNDKYTMFF